MDHVVYLDSRADEMNKLLKGEKTMIIRGAAGRKLPYGRVHQGDILYFINNNAEGEIKAKGKVVNVFNSEKMTRDESIHKVEENQDKLVLTKAQITRWAGKRYLILIEVCDVTTVTPFSIDKSNYANMDDWLLVDDIERVKR